MHDIRIEEPLLAATDRAAELNRAHFTAQRVCVVNIMSSPGAGKTSLLERTLETLAGQLRIGIIEGDIQGSADVDRLARFNVPMVQLHTHGACHLDPRQIATALDELGSGELDLLLIENVGNLVCPAEFDLGEHYRVMLLSVAEGHDKPGKYPLMFTRAHLLLLSKTDLLSQTDFDTDEAVRVARSLNPELTVLPISCRRGTGITAWTDWLTNRAMAACVGGPKLCA